MNSRRAFSLIEMLLAATLVAMLMAAVLALLGGVNRDMRTMRQASQHDSGAQAAADLLGRDLLNAQSVSAPDVQSGYGVTIVGNAGIDRDTLGPDGRLVRVIYRVGRDGALRREQSYLDDPDRPQRWESLAASGISELSVARNGTAGSRLRVTLGTTRGEMIVRDVRMQ
jgi:prepilin-type N-terminal cleavage/methylation domain-containing protein